VFKANKKADHIPLLIDIENIARETEKQFGSPSANTTQDWAWIE